ncbi:MAG: hypothetical protein ACRDLM_01020 [Gaiellaceae bacterium]
MTLTRLGTTLAIAVSAMVIGALIGQPGSGRADTSTAPTNTSPPSISGSPQEGQTLTAEPGTWSGSPTSFAYAWNRCDASGASCTAIVGATATTYIPTAVDVGHTLTVTVTAKNAGGSGDATSAPTAVISSAAAPTNTAAPAVSGTVAIGSTLTVSNGTWSGSPTGYTYSWSRCNSSGASCSKIAGATHNAYALTSADSGTTLRASVVATNNAGSTQATSAPTAVVPAPNGCPSGTGTIQIADLLPPARLTLAHASVTPNPVRIGTQTISLTIKVTACNGRLVQGATVDAVPVPWNQFAGAQGTTGSTGTVTLTETAERFPARSPRQELLAVLVHATKPGGSDIGGVSTRRTFAFQVAAR